MALALLSVASAGPTLPRDLRLVDFEQHAWSLAGEEASGASDALGLSCTSAAHQALVERPGISALRDAAPAGCGDWYTVHAPVTGALMQGDFRRRIASLQSLHEAEDREVAAWARAWLVDHESRTTASGTATLMPGLAELAHAPLPSLPSDHPARVYLSYRRALDHLAGRDYAAARAALPELAERTEPCERADCLIVAEAGTLRIWLDWVLVHHAPTCAGTSPSLEHLQREVWAVSEPRQRPAHTSWECNGCLPGPKMSRIGADAAAFYLEAGSFELYAGDPEVAERFFGSVVSNGRRGASRYSTLKTGQQSALYAARVLSLDGRYDEALDLLVPVVALGADPALRREALRRQGELLAVTGDSAGACASWAMADQADEQP